MATPIGRGPGSVSPDFTAPSVPVANAAQFTPQQTEFERFRDAVVTAGRGVASAVSARAGINARLKQLKEQSVARVEGDLRSAALGLQQRRLERASMQRTEILAEAGTKGMEWAEREFRTGMVNAGSQQESQLWAQAWQGASQQVSRENAEGQQQAFNSAKRTMSNVSRSLTQELGQNVELQEKLIGDGASIGARVQDWMLTEVSQLLDLDRMNNDDADFLIHQVVEQSFGISDNLIDIHREKVRSSNEALATQQVEADIFSTVQGNQPAGALQRQIDVTLRDRLSHLSGDQQRDYVRGVAATQMSELASGTHGIDAIGKIGTGADLLNIRVNGAPLFSGQERQELATDMLNKARTTVGRLVDSEIIRMREAQTQVVTLSDGSVVHRPAANPDLALMTPDPFTGLTPLETAGNRILANLGLLGRTDLSPEGALIVGAVREKTMMRAQESGERAAKTVQSFANQRTVFDGLPGGNANKAHDDSVQRRVLMNEDALLAAGLPAPSAEEVQFLRGAMLDMAGIEGSDLDMNAIREWDGGTVEITPENMPLVRAIQTFDARKWSSGPTQDLYGMPSNLVEEKTALLVSDDPAKVEAFAHWVSNLTQGAQGAWQNYLSELTPNQAAAATLVRVQARLGTGAQRVRPDGQRYVSQVQAVLSAPSIGTWMSREIGDGDRIANASVMAEVMTAAIADSIPDAKFKSSSKDPYGRNLTAQLNELFTATSGNGRMIRDLFFAGTAANPDLAPEAVGSMVWGWLQQSGWRFREVAGRQRMVIDPNSYTGEEGQEIHEHVTDQVARPFSPHYRAFLSEALGLSPMDTPHNLQDLYFKTNESVPEGTDPFGETPFVPRFGFDDTVTSRLLRSRADYGGFEVRMGMADGTDLGNVLSTRTATLSWPDGTSAVVPAGTPLNVINPDIFADAPINRVLEQEPFPSPFVTDVGQFTVTEPADTPAKAAAQALLTQPPLELPGRMASGVPADLNTLAAFLADQPVNTIRPGDRVGPVGSQVQSRSIFNSMARTADDAARKTLVAYAQAIENATPPDLEPSLSPTQRQMLGSAGLWENATEEARDRVFRALGVARDTLFSGDTSRRDAFTRESRARREAAQAARNANPR